MMTKATNIIGWIGTALVFGAVAVRFLRPEWNQYATYAAWAGLACVLIYMAGQWRDVAKFYEGRGAKYGTMSLVSIVVFLAILVAINYLGVRQSKRWDLTANQVYSLSDQTVKVLEKLDAPVKFTVYDTEPRFDTFRGRLNEYKYHSSKVETEYVDADKSPTRAKAAGVTNYGTIVVEYKTRSEKVTSTNEQDLTNALIKVVTGAQPKVYFTKGHGEHDTAGTDRSGYSAAVQSLTSDNYKVDTIALTQGKTVPDDASVVVIAGPKTDFLDGEIEQLKAYTAKGGKVFVLIDPPEKPGAAGNAQPLLEAFLKDWGMTVGHDMVIDISGMSQDPSVTVAIEYPQHPITESFNRVITVFPVARSITPVEGAAHTPQPIVTSSPRSWAETDLASLDKGDKQGPIASGQAVSAPATVTPPAPANTTPGSTEPPKPPETRVVAMGDSDFASNAYLGTQGNRDYFSNVVSWLAQQENLLSIRPREPQDRRLSMTDSQKNSIFLLSIIIIPGLVFGSGVYNWWRRR